MSEKSATLKPPRGLSRLLLRLPIVLYRLRLGWLLGQRFMLIHHRGRKSGLLRQAVVEVVRHDREGDRYIVAAGFGPKSQWYQNVGHTPDVTIQVGRRTLYAHAELLGKAEGGQEMVNYAQRYPRAARNLARLMGYRVDGSETAYRALGEKIPFVAFVVQERPLATA